MSDETDKKSPEDTDSDSAGGGGRLAWITLAFVIVGGAILVYASGFHLNKTETTAAFQAEKPKVAGQPSIGGPFTLVDQDGQTVTDKDFHGRLLLIYFGYTFCPDVCPTTLTDISDALDLLGADAEKITPMLITIDPARDTPEHLKEYATYFHPRLRALTGTPEQIASAAKAYRVYYAKAKMEEDADPEDYLMDHSSVTYLMGPDGAFVMHFSHGTDAETMARRIKEVLL